MDKAIIFVVVSFCVNYFGLGVVLSTIRHLLKPSTIWKALLSVSNFSGLLPSGTKTVTPQPVSEDATDFELAAAKARGLDLGNEDKLKIYGLYKQATHGDNDKPEPSSINLVAHAKWSAWNERKSLSKADAEAEYIATVAALTSDGAADAAKSKARGSQHGGPVSSQMKEQMITDERFEGKDDVKICVLAADNKVDDVRQLLERKVSPDTKDETGQTALHLAADRGHAELVRMLMQYKADVNATELDNVTPLLLAYYNEHTDIALMLLRGGADPTIRAAPMEEGEEGECFADMTDDFAKSVRREFTKSKTES